MQKPKQQSADDGAAAIVRSAAERLASAEEELVLDFTPVRRVDAAALGEMQRLATTAQEKNVKLVVRGVKVEVYKAMKLAGVAGEFSF